MQSLNPATGQPIANVSQVIYLKLICFRKFEIISIKREMLKT